MVCRPPAYLNTGTTLTPTRPAVKRPVFLSPFLEGDGRDQEGQAGQPVGHAEHALGVALPVDRRDGQRAHEELDLP